MSDNKKDWTGEKFEPAEEHYVATEFDDLDDEVEYCVYCYEPIVEWKQSCCGENHFLTGKQIKDHERDLNEVDKRMKGASQ